MKYPKISIIIPTKNEEKNIKKSLLSVKKQKYPGLIETIVVDNFSEDKTVEIAKKLANKVIKKGPERSAQRNFGAGIATGEWLLFVDADMELSPNLISECIELTEFSVSVLTIAVREKSRGFNFWGEAIALERSCYQDSNMLLAARFFPKKLFLQIKGYDEGLNAGEDWDLSERFGEIGVPMFLTRKSFIYHNEPQSGFFEMMKKEAYYIKSIGKYALKHPEEFSYQGSFLYRIFLWLRYWRKLAGNPLKTAGFIFYKLIVWLMWMTYGKFW